MSNILVYPKTYQQRVTHYMYIRQECLLSFDEIIKFQPRTKLELILSQLNFFNLLNELEEINHVHGPK